jgi:hypothetical protein
MAEGYYDKVDRYTKIGRLLSFRLHQSLVEKPLKLEEYMPMFGDNLSTKKDTPVITQELYNQIKKRYNLQ